MLRFKQELKITRGPILNENHVIFLFPTDIVHDVLTAGGEGLTKVDTFRGGCIIMYL